MRARDRALGGLVGLGVRLLYATIPVRRLGRWLTPDKVIDLALRLEDGSELVLVARIEGQALTLEHPYGGWAWLVGHEGVLRLRRAEVF